MTMARMGLGILVTLGLAVSSASGQQQPWRVSADGQASAAQPRQGAADQTPGVEPRAPQGPPPPQTPMSGAPFQLTPQQQAQMEMVLRAWEQRGSAVKTFECDFVRLEYDPVFGGADKPTHTDQGQLKYAAPDKGLFEVTGEIVNGQVIKGQRAEKWITDGKSIFAYDFQHKQVVEHPLPPEMQGKNIVNGPIPFLFGAKADDLKRRFWIRIVTPPQVQGQTWLEVYPRYQHDAANYRCVEVILKNENMLPAAIQVHATNGKNRTVYNLGNPLVNDPLRIFKGNPFHASTPFGWKHVVEQPPEARVSEQPSSGSRQ